MPSRLDPQSYDGLSDSLLRSLCWGTGFVASPRLRLRSVSFSGCHRSKVFGRFGRRARFLFLLCADFMYFRFRSSQFCRRNAQRSGQPRDGARSARASLSERGAASGRACLSAACDSIFIHKRFLWDIKSEQKSDCKLELGFGEPSI